MSSIDIFWLFWLSFVIGFLLAYVIWAPETEFKKGFVDGLCLRFLWRKK